jgi:hypothetical protein
MCRAQVQAVLSFKACSRRKTGEADPQAWNKPTGFGVATHSILSARDWLLAVTADSITSITGTTMHVSVYE